MVRAVQLLGYISAAAALAAPRQQRPASSLAAAVADPALASREAFDQVVQKTYGRYPVTIVKGNGCELEDDAGRTYLDFVAGISTCCPQCSSPRRPLKEFGAVSVAAVVSGVYFD